MLEQIKQLVNRGVLGPVSIGEGYWSWPVQIPELLPNIFREMYNIHGEVRWYGDKGKPDA